MEGTPVEERTPRALLARFDKADAEFNRVLTDVRYRGAWDDTLPPVSNRPLPRTQSVQDRRQGNPSGSASLRP